MVFLVAGLSGAVAEATAIYLEIWAYPAYFFSTPFKLPISIPMIWGAIGILVYRISRLGMRRPATGPDPQPAVVAGAGADVTGSES